METEKISWKQVKRKMWLEERKRDARKLLDGAKDLAVKFWDNKEKIIAGAGAATAVIIKAKRMHDDFVSEREIYDPSLHKTMRLKHRLSTREKREIQARFDAGEKIHDILVDMNVLR